MPDRVAYAILFVDDLEASIRFSRDALGVPFRFSNETYAEFATDCAKFALFARAALPDLIGQRPGRTCSLAAGRGRVLRRGPRRRAGAPAARGRRHPGAAHRSTLG
jgi:catechol 2,3-dioxygenase-like lactoylglutathione lyase family enzyme